MPKTTCVLFDMDGVMIDTEPQYDVFWKHTADKYNIGIPDFEKIIKGTTLPNILKKYFSEYSKNEIDGIIESLDDFEAKMNFPEMPEAINFVKHLKSKNIKVGLVTRSSKTKMVGVNKSKQFDKLFDVIVASEDVVHGKPDPECFLLAAKKLNVDPKNCVVFEDSFAGIEAGQSAGMRVVALATTNTMDKLEKKASFVITGFNAISFSGMDALLQYNV